MEYFPYRLIDTVTTFDFIFRYQRAKKDLDATEKKLLAAEGQVGDLQARLNDAVNQRKHWENEYHVST